MIVWIYGIMMEFSNSQNRVHPYYPAFIDIENKKVLVAGGGQVARRKIETFIEFGAKVNVISIGLCPELEQLSKNGLINFLGSEFYESYLDGILIVVAATDDKEFNRRLSISAKKRGILVNAVDQPEDCSFIVPSIVRRGSLLIAVSTCGKSPALAKKIRSDIEVLYDDSYSIYLELLGNLRKAILSCGLPQAITFDIFKLLVNSNILDCIRMKNDDGIIKILETILPSCLMPKLFWPLEQENK